MDQRAGKHARQTALALLCIDKKIAFRSWKCCDRIIDQNILGKQACDSCSNSHSACELQKITARNIGRVCHTFFLWDGHLDVPLMRNIYMMQPIAKFRIIDSYINQCYKIRLL
jgi:hypothetical protein